MTPRESDLVQSILLHFGSRPGLRLWRVNTGAVKSGQRFIRYGIPGMADISGIRAPSGQRVEIECKTATGTLSEPQRNWRRMIEKHGGLYILARSTDDVERALTETKP